jgi:hypothetical protein
MRKSFKIRRWLVVGVAAGALGTASAAQARPIIDPEPSVGGAASAVTRYSQAAELDGLSPSARRYVARISSLTPAQRVASFGSDGVVDTGPQPAAVTTGSDGFNWGAFAVGIGAGLGLMLIAAALARLTRHRRRVAALH